jgi:putative toxin-antitoxin system antitoxin component (TIGR02293 family)
VPFEVEVDEPPEDSHMATDPDSSLKKSSAKHDSRLSAAVSVANFSLETLSGLDGLQVHDIVIQGIPVSLARNVVRSFVVITPTEIRTVLGISETTLQRRANTTLDANVSDRMLRLLSVAEQATAVLGARDLAERWLAAPAISLDRRRPIELLTSSEGTTMVKALLTRMEYGVYS